MQNTNDADKLKKYFSNQNGPENCVIYAFPQRIYPVDVYYSQNPVENYLESSIDTVFNLHKKEPSGDILLFLTGRDEIEKAVQMINNRQRKDIYSVPLYAGLSQEECSKVFENHPIKGTRKVVV